MIRISKDIAQAMIAHAQREFPNEACGILAGRGGCAEKVYKMANTEKSPLKFFMDPKEQFSVTKEMRRQGLEMIGIYHSHPHSEAYPSARDIQLAYYPESFYVILSLKDKDKPKIRAFKIAQGEVTEEEAEIK